MDSEEPFEGVGINSSTEVDQGSMYSFALDRLNAFVEQDTNGAAATSWTVEPGASWPVIACVSHGTPKVYKCVVYHERDNLVYDLFVLQQLKGVPIVIPFDVVRFRDVVRGRPVFVLVQIMERGLRMPNGDEYLAFMRTAPLELAERCFAYSDWRIENTTVGRDGRVQLIDVLGTAHRVLRTKKGRKHGTIPEVLLAFHSAYLGPGFMEQAGTIANSMVVALESACCSARVDADAAVRRFRQEEARLAADNVDASERAARAYAAVTNAFF